MRKLLMLLLCIPMWGFAQNTTVENLKKELSAATADTVKSDLYCKLAFELQRMDPVASQKMANQSFAIAQKNNFYKGIANYYSFMSVLKSHKGEFDSMRVYSKQCLAIAKQHNLPQQIAKGYNGLGIYHWQTGNFSEAIKNHLAALSIRERIKDSSGISASLGNLALVYFDNQNAKEAQKYALQSLALGKLLKRNSIVVSNLQLLANINGQGGHYEKALKYDAEALAICKNENDTYGLSQVYSNMANCYTSLRQFDKALKYQMEVLTIDKMYGDKKQISDTYMNIGAIYAEKEDRPTALTWVKRGITLSQESKYKQGEKGGWGAVSKLYEQMGDYKNALLAHQKYQALSVALINEASNQQIALMQTKFETEKKEQKISLLNKENTIQKLMLNRHETILAVAVGLLAALGLFGALLYNRKQLKQKALLQAQMLNSQEMLTKAVIDAEEHERKRIAADLHDGVGQLFSAVKMNLVVLFDRLHIDKEEDRHIAGSTMALVDESCKEVRLISHQMMPNVLLKAGLASDLKSFIEKIDTDKLKINLDTHGLNRRLGDNVETMLYRIIQETINNVIKHARATQLDINLKYNNSVLKTTIKDNGVGFDTGKRESFEGIGLKNIMTRIEYLKGNIAYNSSPGKGTTVSILIPLY